MEKRKDNPPESEPLELSLLTTLKEANLQQLTENVLELGIDSLLDPGLLREIPVVSTLIGLIRTGGGDSRQAFCQKAPSISVPVGRYRTKGP